MSNLPIRSVRNRQLSLWQSAVEATIHQELQVSNQPTLASTVRAHPMMQAATAHVVAAQANQAIPTPLDDNDPMLPKHSAAISKLHYEMAEAKRNHDLEKLNLLQAQCRQYATCDFAGWVTCETTYLQYFAEGYTQPIYYDWQHQTVAGQPNINYGVIDYQLPNDAKVALLADWGTGMDDARAMLAHIVATHQPAAIIHLGDIYYAGTPAQSAHNFVDVFNQVFGAGPRVPVFNLPGNHDYYDYGLGFYQTLQQVNPLGQPGRTWQETLTWQQAASYFCLRTADQTWQFLGMDTGQDDHNPILQDHVPALRPSETQWHQDKLTNFAGRSILLSHHQLFSTHSKLSGNAQNSNEALYSVFQPYFSKIAAWFWGHEHNLALFQNNFAGLAKGRLIGCSAYEMTDGEDPYQQHYPQVPYQAIAGQLVRLGSAGDYYNHGYVILDFQRHAATDPIRAAYYQFPSWSDAPPRALPPDQPACLATETIG